MNFCVCVYAVYFLFLFSLSNFYPKSNSSSAVWWKRRRRSRLWTDISKKVLVYTKRKSFCVVVLGNRGTLLLLNVLESFYGRCVWVNRPSMRPFFGGICGMKMMLQVHGNTICHYAVPHFHSRMLALHGSIFMRSSFPYH